VVEWLEAELARAKAKLARALRLVDPLRWEKPVSSKRGLSAYGRRDEAQEDIAAIKRLLRRAARKVPAAGAITKGKR